MATKIRDYTKLAADICDAVAKDNIISAANCATRLRLVLKEVPSADAPQTKQGIGSRIIATMSAVFAPFVYILAAGLVQGALIIITTLLRPFPKPALIRCSASSAGLPSPSCRS